MRRLWALLLCLCLLVGCGAEAPQAETEVPAPVETLQEAPAQEAEVVPPTEEAKQEAALPPPVEESVEVPVEESVEVPVAENAEAPAEEAEPPVTEEPPAEPSCVLSIFCGKALEYGALDAGIRDALPADGWILPPTEVVISAEESVFDVLLRVTRQREIPMEFVDVAVYGSAYIEGIGHLYEFACGGQSGWIYAVNGVSPNVGCSSCTVADGDVITWEYIVERA